EPPTCNDQLPCEPVTFTTLGPAGVAGSVIAAGVVPVARDTVTESTLSTPPDVVSGVGVVRPAIAFGSDPPIPRSNRRKNPWWTAAFQAVTPTCDSRTTHVCRP